MAGSVEVARRIADAPATAARKRFGHYKKVKSRAVRKAEVQENEKLKRILQVWHSCRSVPIEIGNEHKAMQEATKGLCCTANEIEAFCLLLSDFQDKEGFSNYAGIFLSALMHNGKDDEYVINIRHLDAKLNFISIFRQMNVTIEGDVDSSIGRRLKGGTLIIAGDVGPCLGEYMEEGDILVHGNADAKVGHSMSGGRITVHGSVRRHAGYYMRGGLIDVKGNAFINLGKGMSGGRILLGGDGHDIGDRMTGGEIIVDGNARSIGTHMKGGEIHVKGCGGYGIGSGMEDGRIVIWGEAGDAVGIGMRGGEIRLEKDFGGISDWFRGGRIYHRGKLIAGK
jgi:formylmethanofuran dehydrogenase subunit C